MKRLILLLLFLLPNLAIGQPSISSTSGTWAHGGSVTISGSNFGTKSPAAPVMWQTFESVALEDPTAITPLFFSTMGHQAWFNSQGSDNRLMNINSSHGRWIGAPHTNSTRMASAGSTDRFTLGDDNAKEVWLTFPQTSVAADNWFILFYYRTAPDFPTEFGTNPTAYQLTLNEPLDISETGVDVTGSDLIFIGTTGSEHDILKIDSEMMSVQSKAGNTLTVNRGCCGTSAATHSNGATIYIIGRNGSYNMKTGAVNFSDEQFTAPYCQLFGLFDEEQNLSWDFNVTPYCNGVTMCTGTGCAYGSATVFTNQNDARNQWIHPEIRFRNTAGKYQSRVDNQISTNCTCTSGNVYTSSPKTWMFGHYLRYFDLDGYDGGNGSTYHSHNKAVVYWDDVYVDKTLSRVMLANNATYANATIIEPQPPTAWATGSVTVTVNKGKIVGDTAYLFVFDSTDVANTTGYPVTFGVEGPSIVRGLEIHGGTFR